MRWISLQFETTHEASDLVADFLEGLGAAGVQVEDAADIKAILDDPNGLAYADDRFLGDLDDIVRLEAFFAVYPEGVRCRPAADWKSFDPAADTLFTFLPLDRLEELIRHKLSVFDRNLSVGKGYLGSSEIQEEDWADGWKRYYETMHLTERLVINPSWLDYQPGAGEIVIQLDPGSAFGTGSHETTALCAEWLDELVLAGDLVLDLGTGSGILAIIAAKLGAGRVEAIDIDPLAVAVAKSNCEANDVQVDCHAGLLGDAHTRSYDMIVANIIASVICDLAADIPSYLAPDGLFIASGIIAEKMAAVLDAAKKASLELLVCRSRGDWQAAVFRRH